MSDQLTALIDLDYNNVNHYISQISDSFNRQIEQLSFATQAASLDYFSILKAKSTKPIIVDILVNLFVFLAPELGGELVERAAVHGMPASRVTGSLRTLPGIAGASFDSGLKLYTNKMEHLSKKYAEEVLMKTKAAEALTMSKELAEADEISRNRTKEGKNIDQAQFDSASETIKKLGGDLLDLQQKATDLINDAYNWISIRKFELMAENDKNINISINMDTRVRQDFRNARLDIFLNAKVGPLELKMLSDQILYDMLHAYVETYVSFKIIDVSTPRIVIEALATMGALHQAEIRQASLDAKALKSRNFNDLPRSREEQFVNGLDEDQREAIYERFGSRRKYAHLGRVSIDNYIDLISLMGAKTFDRNGSTIQFGGQVIKSLI